MRRHLFLMVAGTTLVTWAFFVGYFQLLRHPVHPVTMMPLTPLDAWVPFVPHAIVPYLSLWFYVGIAPGLQRTFPQLLVYGIWAVLLCMTGLAIFYWWPTAIPPLSFGTTGYFGFDLMQGIDARGNACPSMHVAIAFFSAIWIDVLLRESDAPALLRVVNWTWFVAITLSTLAVRQHVVIDVVAGALLGGAFAIPSLVVRPGRARRGEARGGPDIMSAAQRLARQVPTGGPDSGG
jgi:hypothetical protein